MKIQINSLEALERLIGGDSKLEFDIRQNIVEEFSKKHLKAVVNNDLIQKLQSALTSKIQDDLLETVTSSYTKSYKLTSTAKEFLDKEVGYSVESTLSKLVESKMGSLDILKRIDELLARETDWIENQLKHELIEKKLEALVNKRIKERLGV